MAVWMRSSWRPAVAALKPRPPLTGHRAVHSGPEPAEPAERKQALYPAVVPSRTAKSKCAKRRRIEQFCSQVRAAGEVALDAGGERLRLLTKTQRPKFVVQPQTLAIGADRWYQHFTKTAFVPGLPQRFFLCPGAVLVEEQEEGDRPAATTAAAEELVSEVRALVSDALLQESYHMKKARAFLGRAQEHLVAPFLTNVVCAVTGALSRQSALLRASSLDLRPDVNFYWMRGQRTIPRGHRSGRVEPIRFQIDDKPHSQIRVPQQLPEFLPLEAHIPQEVPAVSYPPDLMPLFKKQYDNNVSIGSKFGDPCCYGHTQFHVVQDRYHRDRLIKAGLPEQVEVGLRANAIASLFAWTAAQAMYQGFWSREDVTRPFVSQAVITDGRYFSFFCYQLNTVALSVDTDAGNRRTNVCWGTESLPLYEALRDGELLGLNQGVLELLVRFLLNAPQLA
ncbi:large ribosomal subunit protein mL65 [Scleropages formosus]|uniref:Mitochondrial ribosomal protein S30 n=1 Tax=Scleropages formosus TaxID=113540 RepID=A0A8C9WDU3_SCLFO|nr:39S ribosomal protein S30, mitochondrial [Scleropages formosus]